MSELLKAARLNILELLTLKAPEHEVQAAVSVLKYRPLYSYSSKKVLEYRLVSFDTKGSFFELKRLDDPSGCSNFVSLDSFFKYYYTEASEAHRACVNDMEIRRQAYRDKAKDVSGTLRRATRRVTSGDLVDNV